MGLTTLEARRARGDLIQVHKIVHGLDRVDRSTWFTMAGDRQEQPTRLSQVLNIAKPCANTELRRNFFSHRFVDNWNKLPVALKSASSVNSFKNG